jgi:hypothetical protein
VYLPPWCVSCFAGQQEQQLAEQLSQLPPGGPVQQQQPLSDAAALQALPQELQDTILSLVQQGQAAG